MSESPSPLLLYPPLSSYIVLMLVYLGVGLAVTTMCIDLVGIQYIQKIHYFGRKVRSPLSSSISLYFSSEVRISSTC